MLLLKGMLKNMKKTKILDANAILRYILYDIPEQADIIENIIKDEIFILPEVIMEVIFALYKFYKIPRKEVSEEILRFLIEVNCDNKIIINAVKNFGIINLDFVDCLLLEYSRDNKYKIVTFDKDLIKFINKRVQHD